ncbi:hypothetical protein D910_10535 [Dendroctonus ponderosae]|uniref:guanylate cyclase n=1 Tax=Dendroctonus ponderosae TaxID=77166 RepID=U4UGX5_DENPD|nr:hypothetical protein D910_10535 [Dendroctonus ponderosae]
MEGQFLVRQIYDDELTYNLIYAAVEVLNIPANTILELFGKTFFEFCQDSGYDKILQVLGATPRDFLQNLDALHDHLGTLYPGMKAPSFRCTERPEDGALVLHYYSDRPGLEHIVIGIVKFNTGNEIKNRIQKVRNVAISTKTVRRTHNDSGLSAKHPANRPLVTIAHKQAKLELLETPHRALIVREYRNEVGIQRLVWPARSPDLNVIEPVWDQLKRRIRRRDLTPENLAELENAVLQEWHNIPQELIRKLLYGISRRLRDIIRARCTVASKLHNTEVEIEILKTKEECDHVQFLITEKSGPQRPLAPQIDEIETLSLEPKVSASTFCRVFPFHIIFDRNLQIVQTGSTVARVIPKVIEDECLVTDILDPIRPHLELTFENILSHINTIYVLKTKHGVMQVDAPPEYRFLRLKGQMLYVSERDLVVFLGYPSVMNLDDLTRQVINILFLLV